MDQEREMMTAAAALVRDAAGILAGIDEGLGGAPDTPEGWMGAAAGDEARALREAVERLERDAGRDWAAEVEAERCIEAEAGRRVGDDGRGDRVRELVETINGRMLYGEDVADLRAELRRLTDRYRGPAAFLPEDDPGIACDFGVEADALRRARGYVNSRPLAEAGVRAVLADAAKRIDALIADLRGAHARTYGAENGAEVIAVDSAGLELTEVGWLASDLSYLVGELDEAARYARDAAACDARAAILEHVAQLERTAAEVAS